MKKFFAICGVIVMVLAVSTSAYAENFFYTVYTPLDLADGPTFLNGQGGVPFGYDPDMPPPIGSLQSGPAGFGDSCYWSDVQGSAAGDPNDRDYTSFRMSPKDIFGLSDVTISDLSYISYWTKNLDTSLIDWQLKIYTESTAKWYGYRFNFTRPQNPDNTNWYHSSTTSGLDNHLKVNDIYDKVAGAYIPVPGSGKLSDLFFSYGSEKILFIDIIAGFATSSPPVDSLLDGVEIELQSDDVATMDLEAAVFSCVGFEPPMDNGIVVKVKKNRVLPLKAEVVDSSGNPVTDAVIGENPPYIEVTRLPGQLGDPTDVTSEALSAGHGTDGNEVTFDGVKWFYNLGTKMFTSPGDYEIIMKSPDKGLYIIDPLCEAYFNIERR